MNGQLFTQDFLISGIAQTPVWKNLNDASIDALVQSLKSIYQPFSANSRPNEATTEQEIIVKVLAQLGWSDLALPQVSASGSRREDVPDLLLFPDLVAKAAALNEKRDARRYRQGIAILESKRWLRALDRGDATDRLDPGTPSNQMLRYLSAAEVASERAMRWGILTNGALWRLYFQGARSRSEDFLEIDIAAAIGVPGAQPSLLTSGTDTRHVIKVFFCLFHRAAFLTQDWDSERRSFHEYALAEARHYEERVSQDLGERVFGAVFPDLADALANSDPKAKRPFDRAYLEEVREAALILLYRLLFVLYAEDRELLPVRDKRYSRYSLRRLREEVRDQRDKSVVFSKSASRLWDEINTLFRAIANGDTSLGLPAYNGGLFEDTRASLLARVRVPDAKLASVIDDLSRRAGDVLRAWINYRDLSVQHLGSIYERLLEYRLEEEGGRLLARPTSFARRGSGSYYTHDDLVKLLIEEAVGPLLAERKGAFEARVTALSRKRAIVPHDLKDLEALDPASRILELRVCDPAMGSGHFLVALVDELADRILESISYAAEIVAAQRWAKYITEPWVSPVAKRIEDIRKRILAAGAKQGWAIDPAQLDDRHVIRRMILKRVIHGVDKNPMAVELAKVALWLHTFMVGAPLSFLDHHLRCGDALFGGRVSHLKQELGKLTGELLQQQDLRQVDTARLTMQAIGELTDIDIAEAHQSKALMDKIDDGLLPLKRGLDFLQAKRWARKADAKDYAETWADLLNHEYGDNLLESLELLSKRGIRLHNERQQRAHRVVQDALARAGDFHFLHWELAFPTIWQSDGEGGFDAVIGNPPWDVMEMQEVEWFAERDMLIAKATNTADRNVLIQKLRTENAPLWREFQEAIGIVETAARVVRQHGDYPTLSGGKLNLYKLFVERAASLINERGLVGLLTPSGISADKTSVEFFREISSSGRLAALFDFENKRAFFPDIDSRFKFTAIVFGGKRRTFSVAKCAFFLHSVNDLTNPERLLDLAAEDFLLVNPNTGMAPVFRTRRDAKITATIYRRQPVFIDRRLDPPRRIWAVHYAQGLFNMATDAHLFMRRQKLEELGWYPKVGNIWSRGEEEAVPLYEGKLVQMYDHRAARIVVNAANLKRAAQEESITSLQHSDVNYFAEPQYWVPLSAFDKHVPMCGCIAFKDVTSPTNIRTMIATWIPRAGVGHTLPVLLPDSELSEIEYARIGALLLANLNSLVFDYVARQKVQGQHVML
jgi:hypothetical protein